MTKYLLPTLGLAVLCGVAFLGQAPTAAQAGECCGAAGCETGCCNGGCQTGCCDCCPRCGCKLVPVCHMTCETKKTTDHEYCCKCKDICIPSVTHFADRVNRCGSCNECTGGCAADAMLARRAITAATMAAMTAVVVIAGFAPSTSWWSVR